MIEFLKGSLLILLCLSILSFLVTIIYFGYKMVRELTEKRKYSCRYKAIDEWSDTYDTECGNQFYDASETGNPITDWSTYCPYCGGKIKL